MSIIALIDFLDLYFQKWGYLSVFLGSLIEISPFGWMVPGGTILAAAGFFAASGHVSLTLVIISGWFGSWSTFILAYILGRKSGAFLIKKFNQEKHALEAEKILKSHGGVILTTSLLSNLVRFWVAYLAGVEKYNLAKYLIYSGTASLTWTSLFVTLGYLAGGQRDKLASIVGQVGALSWILLIIALIIAYIAKRKLRSSHENY